MNDDRQKTERRHRLFDEITAIPCARNDDVFNSEQTRGPECAFQRDGKVVIRLGFARQHNPRADKGARRAVGNFPLHLGNFVFRSDQHEPARTDQASLNERTQASMHDGIESDDHTCADEIEDDQPATRIDPGALGQKSNDSKRRE